MPRTYASLIQADYGRSRHGNFEAVLVQNEHLWHWFRDNSRNDFGPWFRGLRITGERDNVTGPGCLIQSDLGTGAHGNFEVVVPLHLGDNSIELRYFFRDTRGGWIRAQFITQSCAGLGGVMQSSFGSAPRGNFEVLVDECRG